MHQWRLKHQQILPSHGITGVETRSLEVSARHSFNQFGCFCLVAINPTFSCSPPVVFCPSMLPFGFIIPSPKANMELDCPLRASATREGDIIGL